jgi:hypothetical protein
MKNQPLPGFQGLVVVRGDWVRQNLVAPLYFGNRAPGRVRSQAAAQNHQGPQETFGNCGPWHCRQELASFSSSIFW